MSSIVATEVPELVRKYFTECDPGLSDFAQLFNPKSFLNLKEANCGDFWRDYVNCIKNKRNGKIQGLFNFAEKPGKHVPIIGECFIKFSKSDTPGLYKENWEDIFIAELISAYQTVIRNNLEIRNTSSAEYIACILVPEQEDLVNDNHRMVHFKIQFPFCRVEQNILKRLIRREVLDILRKRNVMSIFPEAPLNGIESIIAATTTDDYVPLYGSVADPKSPHYVLRDCYGELPAFDVTETDSIVTLLENRRVELDSFFDPSRFSKVEQNIIHEDHDLFTAYGEDHDVGDLYDYLPILLSLEFSSRCVALKDSVDMNSLKMLKNHSSPPSTNATPSANNTNVYEETDFDIAQQLLPLLSDQRSKDEHYWLDVCKALYNSDKDPNKVQAFRIAAGFTERSDERDQEILEEMWDTFGVDNSLTVKTIAWYARKDNPQGYISWHEKKYKPFLERSLSGSHDDVAWAFYWIYWLDFICANVKNKTWYVFNNHILREADSGREIRIKLGGDFKNYYEKLQVEISRKITSTNEEHLKAKYQMDLKKIGGLIGKLKNVPFKSSILTALLDIFKDDRFEHFANQNVNLMGVDGGVLECCSKYAIVREGKPEDYVTMASTVKWNPKLTWNSPQVKKVMKWMMQIFTDQDLRTYFLRLIASCLRSKNKNKILPVLSGMGDNSKSMLKKFIELIFGPYSHTFPVHVFTTKSKGGPSPDTASARFAKVAWFTEPPEDSHIMADALKSHTGMDRMRGRMLYSNGDEYDVLYTLFLMCNKIPLIQGADKAIINRLRIILCDSTWSLDAPESEEEQFKMKRFKTDLNFESQIPYMTSAGLWVLVQFYAEYMNKGLQQPIAVTKATSKYFSENDLYKKFLEENIEDVVIPGTITPDKPKGDIDNSAKLSLTDMYQIFKGWARSNFGSMKVPDQPVFMYHMLQRLGKPNKKEYLGIRIKEVVGDKVAHI